MKVNLAELENGFKCHAHKICDIDCFLIVPQIDVEWNSNNLYQRSLVVDKNGIPLSSGFPKFFNFGEKPTCYPNPTKFMDWKIDEKIDGTLVICDFINGQFNMRTRGTVTYKSQENSKDFELLVSLYPKIAQFLNDNSHLSLLFELVTPNNIIVVRPQQIKFYFLGAVNKTNLQMLSSEESLSVWRSIGCPLSPDQYSFEVYQDLQKIASVIKEWKGKEGIVLTYNKGQNKVKIKSDWYCWIHRIKTQLNTESNLIEYYVDSDMPASEDFFKKIEKEFDYEIACQLESEISKIVEKGNGVKTIVQNMKDFVASIRKFETRKQQAEYILLNYKMSNRSQFVFSLLDGKELTKEQLIKLMTS